MLSHRHALNFVRWCASGTFDVGPEDTLSNHAPLHFDLSVFDLYLAALAGATVVPVPEEIAYIGAELASFIEREAITIWYSVPSALTMLASALPAPGALPHAADGVFAGEVFPTRSSAGSVTLLPRVDLWNLYGPTETNVCTYYRVRRAPAGSRADPRSGERARTRRCSRVRDDGQLAGDRRGRRALRSRRGRDGRVLGAAREDGRRARPTPTARRACAISPTAPATSSACVRTGTTSSWDAEITRSRAAATGSSSATSRLRLTANPDLLESAVVAVPHIEWGTAIVAWVVPRNGSTITEGPCGGTQRRSSLATWCRRASKWWSRCPEPRTARSIGSGPHRKLDRGSRRMRKWTSRRRWLVATLGSPAARGRPGPAGDGAATGHRIVKDTTYVVRPGGPLALDAYLPTGPGPHPRSCDPGRAVDVHRQGEERLAADKLAERGIAAFAINYRPSTTRRSRRRSRTRRRPCRFVRANAERFHVDPHDSAPWANPPVATSRRSSPRGERGRPTSAHACGSPCPCRDRWTWHRSLTTLTRTWSDAVEGLLGCSSAPRARKGPRRVTGHTCGYERRRRLRGERHRRNHPRRSGASDGRRARAIRRPSRARPLGRRHTG